jgi:methionyl-tRNA formyltransferase
MGMKSVFLGTPDFAVPSLEHMIAAGHSVVTVITQPDRPKGRKQELIPSPVKAAALRHGIPVFQPERIRRPEAIEHLRALQPEIMVVVGYGQIIPRVVIDIAPRGIINVHASLLPELRGAAPIQWAIARGRKTTGVTTMQIDEGLDTGGILMQSETAIDPDETAVELSPRLAVEGAQLLVRTLTAMEQENLPAAPQDSSKATLAPILKKDDGRINWTRSAGEIHNHIRGLQPWPGAFTCFRGQTLHLWRSHLSGRRSDLLPGALINDSGVFVTGGDGAALEILEVQLEGRKRMPAAVFANGQRLTNEERFA